MMKKTKWLAVPLSVLLLAACGNNNDKEDVTNVPENAPTEQNGNTTGTNDNNGTNTNDNTGNNKTVSNANAAFDFTHFSVDADYSMTESFEVEYENEQSGVEASIEDDVKGERVYGNEAYARLEPIFQGFTFDQSTADDEVIAEVLKGFDLSEDYQDIEIEVRFADGTEKEYHKRK
ncbi:MAG: YusW family protein [Lysinibacillus sp.]